MSPAQITERVESVRKLMQERDLHGILIRGTDRYLNEYVPTAESTRVWLTGFTGSTGDAFLTRDAGWVAVDGRYYLQADTETEGTPFGVERVPLGTAVSTALTDLAKRAGENGAKRIGYEPDRYSVRELERLRENLEGIELVPTSPSLIEEARGPVDEPTKPVRAVADEAVGRTVAEKVALARPALEAAGVDGFVVVELDALAYLTNLRGDDLPYQATFRGLGVLTREKVVLAVDASRIDADVREARKDALELVAPDGWAATLSGKIGYDPAGTTAAVVDAIRAAGAEPVSMKNPLTAMKAKKTPAELEAMKRAFALADGVVERSIAFVRAQLDAGERVTEKDLADEVTRQFLASGATGLSFKVISAAGKNGAIIHYSTPDPDREIQAEELVLLDTGGYYAEGYATDLTRTFLAGSPEKVPEATAEQKRIWTLVLKAAIAGMSARLPADGTGVQLDAITRAPLWAVGMDFRHGTGHGVGINVHEAPPRVSTKAAGVTFEEGHVFSIEPGLYLPEFGGVRIENLCTVAPAKDAEGFVDVVPLTFAELDERLIDWDLLDEAETAWLKDYRSKKG